MKIAVRMDDITPNMDWKKFLEFKMLLDKHGIRPLIGVVPDNRDENLNREAENGKGRERKGTAEFWEYIRSLQSQGWVIAMHGYQHVYTQKKRGMFPLNDFSEFAGLGFEQQFAMLEKGASSPSTISPNLPGFPLRSKRKCSCREGEYWKKGALRQTFLWRLPIPMTGTR